MENLNHILSEYDGISLDQLESVRLLNRRDIKFVFNQSKLPCILESLKSAYQVLSINGSRIIGYENLYFDTDDFLFYRQHHNGKRPRYKVRLRRYLQPDICYFEVKFRSNKGRMIKRRIRIPHITDSLGEPEKEMVRKIVGLPPEKLIPKLNVKFSRTTVVDAEFKNRVTIDSNISVKNGEAEKHFENLVIAEVKQQIFQPGTFFAKVMKESGIQTMRISKYCMGILHTYDSVKYNRFKPKLLRINKLMSENSFTEVNQ